MNIKYRQLKGFVLAAELGSFKAAANALCVTQASFSALIKDLEDDLGVLLFERSARKCELTQAGAMFYRDIPTILEQLEHSYGRMTEVATGRTGSLSIATLGSLSVGIIAKTLGDFQRAYPEVRVTMRELQNNLIFEAVANGTVDLGIGALLRDIPVVHFEPLFTDQLMLVAPKGHPLEGPSVRWQALAQHPYVLMSTGPAEHALRANSIEITPVLVVEHLSTAVAMVRHGVGVTVLPSCVLGSLNLNGLVCIPLEGHLAVRNLGVSYRDESWLNPAALNFLQMLRQAVPDESSGWRRADAKRILRP